MRALLEADEQVVRWLNGLIREAPAVRRLVTIGASSLATVEVGLMGLVALSGRPVAAARMLLAVGVIYGLIEVVGQSWKRARPFATSETIKTLVRHNPSRSFPSRHVASAFAMAMIAAPARPAIGRLMGRVAWLLALTRVGAGLHYPSDAGVGAFLGLAIGWLLRQR